MNPLRLRASNYRTFDEVDLELPSGCVAVTGENGAGKSSIVNVIDLCLFGPESRSLGDYLAEDAAGTEMELELEFEHGNELYRVRRHFSAKGRGQTKLDLERRTEFAEADDDAIGPATWEPLTAENQKATQAALERLLGLSRETFRASAFLAQGDGAAFTEAKPADRKRILADALGLDGWAALLKLAARDRRASEKTLDEVTGRIRMMEELSGDATAIEEALVRQRDKVNVLVADLAVADAALEAKSLVASKLEGAATVWMTRLATVTAAKARLAELERVAEEAVEAVAAAAQVREELDRFLFNLMPELEEEERRFVTIVEAYRSAVLAREQAQRDREAASARRNEILSFANEAEKSACALREKADHALAHAGEQTNTCATCGQTLGVEAAERTARSYRADAETLEAEAATRREQAYTIELPTVSKEPQRPVAAEEGLASTRASIAAARESQAKRAALEERLRGLDERAEAAERPEFVKDLASRRAAVDEAETALAEVEEPEPGALDSAKAEALSARMTAESLRESLRLDEQDLSRIEERLAQAKRLADDLATHRAQRDQAQARLDDLIVLEQAYGRDGIPALIVEQAAIPSIETEANRILAELGTSYRVELRTEAALKSGDGTRDTLDVVVIADAGERPYETFSGGERTRINLALRLALAELLSTRRGSESRLLAIDEPEFLDETGTMRLADVLRGLHAAGKFDRILLISHVPTLRDALDVSLEVVKDAGRSRVIA